MRWMIESLKKLLQRLSSKTCLELDHFLSSFFITFTVDVCFSFVKFCNWFAKLFNLRVGYGFRMNFLVPRQEIAIGKHEHVCYERRNHFVLILQKVVFIHIPTILECWIGWNLQTQNGHLLHRCYDFRSMNTIGDLMCLVQVVSGSSLITYLLVLVAMGKKSSSYECPNWYH